MSKGTTTQVPITTKIGRIPILAVSPVVEGGQYPAKGYEGEVIPFSAKVFREGHDSVAAEVVLTSPTGRVSVHRMHAGAPGTDLWHASAQVKEQGRYSFAIRAFEDGYLTWHHNAEIKIHAGIDVDLMLLEGVNLFTRAAGEAERSKASVALLNGLVKTLQDTKLDGNARLAAAEAPEIVATVTAEPIRSLVTLSETFAINVERKLAGFGAWYEFFPRSEGAKLDPETGVWTSGTFKTAGERLAAVKAMGFDILYMPPIHPIGTAFRKGPNNTLTVGPQDPGSPWAIGNTAGGHDTIHPDLGTMADFEAFVKKANKLGLEIAMDLALQASPDHPWLKEHPEWFTARADGSIAYAENPPKKYQDIYPINFDNDPEGIYHEVLRIVELWISKGVKIFRVDNPHTKPVNFWEWLLGQVNSKHPDVIFLAEAFTRPSMMHTLGKIGYQQSYTYFTWRNSKWELEQYLTEVAHDSANFFRPNFWVTTPDILTEYLQFGGRNAHKIRAALAAMATPNWGMYAGYELIESVARQGAEEHVNSEKYEYKQRDWAGAEAEGKSIAPYVTRLNQIRHENEALHYLRNLEIHPSDDSAVICFSKHVAAEHSASGKANTIIVVVNTDPHSVRESTVHLNLAKLGLGAGSTFTVTDLITGASFVWGEHNYVRLDAFVEPAHVLRVEHS
ncbi:MAG: alpha-1,4-glucan--maltose-1-phosphate maltosyltransferase [Micrococcales bacterium]